jgi:hypothetical protein
LASLHAAIDGGGRRGAVSRIERVFAGIAPMSGANLEKPATRPAEKLFQFGTFYSGEMRVESEKPRSTREPGALIGRWRNRPLQNPRWPLAFDHKSAHFLADDAWAMMNQ